jgi:hypothetical protein
MNIKKYLYFGYLNQQKLLPNEDLLFYFDIVFL